MLFLYNIILLLWLNKCNCFTPFYISNTDYLRNKI